MNSIHLLEWMFAVGHEPVRIRVTPHHKLRGIMSVINALDRDEVELLHTSSFRKFVGITDKPSFSGSDRFIISRQLSVNKKHEIWISREIDVKISEIEESVIAH